VLGYPNFFTPRRARLHAAALVVGLWAVTAINFATPGVRTLNNHIKGEDWAHFWAVGRVAARHDPRGIYDVETLRTEFARATGDAEPPTFVPVYGPQLALALVPFGVLPYGAALILWWAAAALTYYYCCRTVWRRYPELGSERHLLLFAAAYPGFWQLFIHGQTTWIALACFTVLWWSLRENRVVPAGIALGLLAYKPQLAIAVVVLLLVRKSWPVLLLAAVTVAAQAAICLLWFGAEVFRAYASILSALPRISELLEPKTFQLVSLRGFFLLLGASTRWANILWPIPAAVVLSVVVQRQRGFDLSFALLLVATILAGVHTSVYDLVLLAPAFIILAGHFEGRTPRGLWLLMYAAFLLPLTGPLAAITRVQLATPILVALITAATRSMKDENES
jgi:hypothetical protein